MTTPGWISMALQCNKYVLSLEFVGAIKGAVLDEARLGALRLANMNPHDLPHTSARIRTVLFGSGAQPVYPPAHPDPTIPHPASLETFSIEEVSRVCHMLDARKAQIRQQLHGNNASMLPTPIHI